MNTAIRNGTSDEQLMEAAGDPTQARWSTMENLTATLIDEVRQLAWIYTKAHTEQSVPKPEPVQRPGVRGRKVRKISLANARRLDPRLRLVPDEDAQGRLDYITGRT